MHNMQLLAPSGDRAPTVRAYLAPPTVYDTALESRSADVFQDALAALRRRLPLVAGVAAGLFVLGAAVTILRPPIYEAAAILMMGPREPEGVVASAVDGLRPPDTGYVDSQVEILRSPALAGQLVDQLNLGADTEWNTRGDRANRADIINAVMRAMNPHRRGSTYVVEVAVRSKDPEQAARMSNALVEIYVASRARARVESAERTSVWLDGRLTQLRTELAEREGVLEAYRAEAGLLSVNGVTFTEQQMQEGETSVLAARVDLAERQARWRQAQRVIDGGGSGDSMVGALTSDVMAQLRERQAEIDRTLASYDGRYGAQHPSVIAAQAEKLDVDRQIGAEVGRLTESLRNEAEVSRVRAGALQAHVSSVRAELLRNNSQVARLNELERGVASTRAIYASFEQRSRELANGAAGVGGDAQLIAAASPPTRPISQSLFFMLGLTALVAALAGAFAGWVAEALSTRLHTADEVERKIGLPILTTIPRLGAREFSALPHPNQHPGGFATARPRSAFAESMRLLRSRISWALPDKRLQIIAIASALPGDGKTTTALSLARVAAMSGRRTILVDCDLRGRSLNVLLGIEPQVGIVEVLRHGVNWRHIVGKDESSGAHILPASTASFTTEDIFDGSRMKDMLQELVSDYDLIVLDCPPVLTLAEAREIAILAEGVVLVARHGKTPTSAVRTALNELRAVGANVLGVALNGVDPNAPGRTSYSDPLYFTHGQAGAYTE
jgi:succinoglycan biosynthesis transport protein ExoP